MFQPSAGNPSAPARQDEPIHASSRRGCRSHKRDIPQPKEQQHHDACVGVGVQQPVDERDSADHSRRTERDKGSPPLAEKPNAEAEHEHGNREGHVEWPHHAPDNGQRVDGQRTKAALIEDVGWVDSHADSPCQEECHDPGDRRLGKGVCCTFHVFESNELALARAPEMPMACCGSVARMASSPGPIGVVIQSSSSRQNIISSYL